MPFVSGGQELSHFRGQGGSTLAAIMAQFPTAIDCPSSATYSPAATANRARESTPGHSAPADPISAPASATPWLPPDGLRILRDPRVRAGRTDSKAHPRYRGTRGVIPVSISSLTRES